jgi:hypothetical protein
MINYKYFLSVCVCIKNEKKYIDDFINHYICQGVDNIYIINNGSNDGIEEHIEKSNNKSFITLINDSRDLKILQADEGAQGHKTLLDDNLNQRIREESEWAIFVDADEFMYGKNGYTIKKYLEELDTNISCVYVLWNIFNPVKPLDNEFSLKKNIKRLNYDRINDLSHVIKNANDFGKSVIRTSMLTDNKLWIHKIQTYGIRINNYGIIDNNWYDNGNNINYSEYEFSKLKITLNHYAIRNIDDYNKKIQQIINVPHKTYFINGLLHILELDDDYLITDENILT